MDFVNTVNALLGLLGGIWLLLGLLTYGLRRPRIEIRTRPWRPRDPVPWAFAVIDVRNAASPRWIPFLTRETAFGCEIAIQFFRNSEAATEPIAARWSDRPEPIRYQIVDSGVLGAPPGTAVRIGVLAPDLVPPSKTYDLPAGGRWQEVAVAVLRDKEAYGWGADSYAYDWKNPNWKLDRGVYDVRLTIQWNGGSMEKRFALPFLSTDIGGFELTPPHSTVRQ